MGTRDSELGCVPCQSPCKHCKSFSKCTSCEFPRILQGTYCKCQPGYHKDLSNPNNCIKCDNQCKTCNGYRSSCTECQGLNRSTIFPDCSCNAGYYHDGPADCVQCTLPDCVECTKTECTKCEPAFYLNGGVCGPCVGSNLVLDSGVCKECLVKCTSCSGTADNCGGCTGDNRSAFFPGCECLPTYYDDGINANCASCVSPCINWESASKCTSCIDTHFISDVVAGTCTECDKKCGNCSGSAGNCGSCQGVGRSTVFPACECLPTYYDDLTNADCLKCTEPCANCENSDSHCTSCIVGFYLVGNRCDVCNSGCISCDNTGKCTGGVCQDGYVFNGSSGDCDQCDEKCLTCQNTTDECIDCIDSSRDNTRNCACNFGKYRISPNISCSNDCPSNCKQCENETGTCTQCYDTNMTLDSGNNTCTCNDLYYDNSNNGCNECDPGCMTCDTTGKCTGNTCLETFVFNSISGDCDKCTVVGCQNCSSDKNICTQCFDLNADPRYECSCKLSYVYDYHSESCVERICTREHEELPFCKCKEGFYLNPSSDKCEVCESPCLSCLSLGNCLECVDDANRGNYPSCSCKEGYFENEEKVCESCLSNTCSKCDSQGKCVQCLNSDFEPPLCVDNIEKTFQEKLRAIALEKVVEDVQGKEQNGQGCALQCKNCESSDRKFCKECYPGNFREVPPSCKCMYGYHDNDGTTQDCEKCPEFCLFCNNSEICLVCEDKFVRNQFTGQCQCEEGFFWSRNELFCKRCFFYIGECLEICPKNTVANEKDFICEEIEYEELNNLSFILLFLVLSLASIASTYIFIGKSAKKYKVQMEIQRASPVLSSISRFRSSEKQDHNIRDKVNQSSE